MALSTAACCATSCAFALSIAALSALTVAAVASAEARLLRLILRDDAALAQLRLALGGELLVLGVGRVARELRFGLAEQRLVAHEVRFGLRELRLDTRAGRS